MPPRTRAALGALTLAAALVITWLRAQAVAGPLDTLARFEAAAAVGPVSQAGLESARYHAAHARDAHDARWGLTGYALQGLLAALAGAGLLGSGLRAGVRAGH